MHILHLNTTAHAGGAARAMYRLHQGLQQQGHHSAIVARLNNGLADPNVHELATLTRPQHRPGDRLLTPAGRIAELSLGLPRWAYPYSHYLPYTDLFRQADVLNLHNLPGGYFNYRLLPQLTAAKPTVWTLHDMWPLTGHCAYAYDCERWRTGCHHCPLLRRANHDLVEPRPTWRDLSRPGWQQKAHLYRQSRLTVVAPSRWLQTLAQQSILGPAAPIHFIPHGIDLDLFRPGDQAAARHRLGLPAAASVLFFSAQLTGSRRKGLAQQSILGPAAPIHFIPHGIDLDLFRPGDQAAARHRLGLPAEASVLFFSAQLTGSRRKGLAELLAALAQLPPAGATAPPTWLLTIGETGAVAHLGGQYHLRELGYLSDEARIRDCYVAADLFVFPTRADNQPLVLLEALACGTPAVSFAVGGVPEMVREGETGLLAPAGDPAGDPAGLAHAIHTLLHNPTLRHRLAHTSRHIATTEYDLKLQVARYEALYKDLLPNA